MIIKRFISSVLVLLLAVVSFQAASKSVSASVAQETANNFMKSHYKASSMLFKAPAKADFVLAHAEPLEKQPSVNAYYIFNIKGGGFIIVSGEDRAIPVLGYCDNGRIDINNIPEPLRELLDIYKADIDYLLTHKTIKTSNSNNRGYGDAVNVVEPMLKTSWGQQEPYNILCPILKGKYSKTGCSAVAMAQTVYFWRFPTSCDTLPPYYASRLSDTVPAFPATVFDFDKMLPSYSHWDFDNQVLVQDTYTDEEALAVAELTRFCGHSVMMNYSPASSGPQTNRPAALRNMGYNPDSHTIYRKYYTDEKWLSLLKGDLSAGIPVMYTAYNKGSDVGHVFMLDGYDSEDYFHINFGWFGHGNGWYQISAIVLTYLDGTPRNYIGNNSFIIGLEPPLFCTIDAEVGASSGLHLLGETLTALASDVKLSMSYRTLPFMFSLTDADGGQVALSESITLNRLTFENGSDISLALTLPETLPEGVYDLHLNYLTGDNDPLTQALTATGQLYVLGKFAKYGTPFGIADVVEVIDMILQENPQVNIADVTMLIDHMLAN